MQIYIKELKEKRELKLVEYKGVENIAEKFLNEVNCLSLIHTTEDGSYCVSTEDHFLEWEEAIAMKQECINTLGAYTERTGDALSARTLQGIQETYRNSFRREHAPIDDFQLAIRSEKRTLDLLLNTKLVVSKPVNKKFWPLVNTSHTFKVLEFEERDTYKEGLWWQVVATIKLELLSKDPKNCASLTGKAMLNMAFQDGRLVATQERYAWTMPMTIKQENEAIDIIQAAIHAEFAVRGINEEYAECAFQTTEGHKKPPVTIIYWETV